MQLESFARKYLWEVGCDFGHGVGHGVSHCGPVHEYPHYAFARTADYQVPLKAGMVLTNEPGFYKAGEWGIRIENVLSVAISTEGFLKFENNTLVPYCKELIDKELLKPEHVTQIKEYYEEI
jgi:Xaa-Pro aminopeptidase